MNKAELDLKVIRTGPGKYTFGTKTIMAKIVNERLIIRVGAGSMGPDDFIMKYGAMEIAKRDELENRPTGSEAADTNATGRKSISTRDSATIPG